MHVHVYAHAYLSSSRTQKKKCKIPSTMMHERGKGAVPASEFEQSIQLICVAGKTVISTSLGFLFHLLVAWIINVGNEP
jgi:hypothetical protein